MSAKPEKEKPPKLPDWEVGAKKDRPGLFSAEKVWLRLYESDRAAPIWFRAVVDQKFRDSVSFVVSGQDATVTLKDDDFEAGACVHRSDNIHVGERAIEVGTPDARKGF